MALQKAPIQAYVGERKMLYALSAPTPTRAPPTTMLLSATLLLTTLLLLLVLLQLLPPPLPPLQTAA